MAITKQTTQITWSAASSVTISSATEVVSDVFTLADNCIGFSIQLSADNAGTPASGDTAVCRLRWTTGDILGDSGDDYDTAQHAQYLATLDTFATNTPGEDPARRTVGLGVDGAVKFQLGVVCANAGTRNIVFRARVVETLLAA